ncbi:MAG: hypothetical protein KAS07_00795 [Candidatus Pacebacteria bacterium]|nr:hypothetical protein [Candidatus Paceibacterota bacterium]
MYEDQLTKIGLSKDQAAVYECLIKHGAAQASLIARRVSLSRPLVYKILGELEEFGLVEKKEESGKIAIFHPSHPSALNNIVLKKKSKIEESEQSLVGILDKLTSDYNLHTGKPGIRFFSGTDGFKKMYQDIYITGKDLLLVRGTFEEKYNKLVLPITEEFIKSRVRKKMKVTAITPTDTSLDKKKQDAELLFDRTWVPLELYNSPVEIIIYGDKIAYFSYAKELIGVIIESPQIAQSMKMVFELARMGATKST